MRLAELLRFGAKELSDVGIVDAELDARLLLESATGKSRTEIYLDADKKVDDKQYCNYLALLGRRKKREPVAYILGEQEFWSLTFSVSPGALIPRPETEFLLDRVFALTREENFDRGDVLDLCCGSGVIAVVLAKELDRKVIALDISHKALALTGTNAKSHGLSAKVLRVQGDLLTSFPAEGNFSLIVSNPPYVNQQDVLYHLEPEVCCFEPHLALDGGEYGLDIIEKIYDQLHTLLLPGGDFFMEFGADQGDAVWKLFSSGDSVTKVFDQVKIIKDYAGRDRVLHARKRVE